MCMLGDPSTANACVCASASTGPCFFMCRMCGFALRVNTCVQGNIQLSPAAATPPADIMTQ